MKKLLTAFPRTTAAFLLLLAGIYRAEGGGAYNMYYKPLEPTQFDQDNITFKCTGPLTYQVFMNGIWQGVVHATQSQSFTESYVGRWPDEDGAVRRYTVEGPGGTVVYQEDFIAGTCFGCNDHTDGGTATSITRDIVVDAAPTTPPLPNTTCSDIKLGGDQSVCNDGKECPMAQYSVHAMLVSLNIQDTPLRYSPPRGPSVDFKVTYNQKESQQPTIFSYPNLGPKWTFGWLAYIVDDPNTQRPSTSVYVPGGGTEIHQFNSTSGTFLPNAQSHTLLVKTSASSYERYFPDGSKQVFDKSSQYSSPGAYPRKLFMTKMVDPAGNALVFEYDPNNPYKITRIKDALNQETKLYYEHPTDRLKITKVEDPFGRFATFHYVNGHLARIVDEIGIESQFTYIAGITEETDSIESLTTPYGTTLFASDADGTSRWIEITDPLSGKERVEYRESGGTLASDPVAPNAPGIVNAGLDAANTFYWDRKAMSVAPGDSTKAQIKHWLYNADETVSGILSSEKKALENRVWYTYADQPDYLHVGPSANPTQVARVLADGATQLRQFEYYNPFHKLTKATDPMDRETTYQYAANGIDLTAVFQGNDQIFGSTFTDTESHLPHVVTDAAGQPTTYTYTASKQLETVTNAKNETTTFAYGDTVPDGYLASITSPQHNKSSAVITLGYDAFNRVDTVTNVDQDMVTTEYDHLDRKTRVTYPDTTYEEFQYIQDFGQGPTTILDLTASRDRLGRWTYRHYTANRQMDSITDPEDRTTEYNWCVCGSLTSITDAKDQTTTFHRDLQGRVHQKVFFDDTTINYVYEDQSGPNTAGATSRLESSTDALNRRTNYTYFKDNNLDEVRYSDTADNPLNPPTPTVGYTYDEDYNRLKKIWIDGVIETEYEYYPVSVLGAGKVQSIDGPLTDDIIGFTYDKLGRVVEQSINDVTQSIDYDSLGRLSNTKSDVLGSIDRSYDGLTRRLQAVNYPNGQTTNYTYFGNTHDRRLEILENLDSGSMNLSKFDYTYDDEGQIMSWTSLLGATTSGRWFEYDDARQLLSARNASDFNSATHVYGYGYDPAGNRIIDSISNPQDEGSATSNSYSVNTVNAIETISIQNGMLSWEAVLVYDLAGNMTDDGQGKTFEWDAANRVVAVNYVGTTKRSEFTYDGLCRRVKIVEKTGSTVTSTKQFVWMGARIAQERDANDEVTRRYYPEGEERIKSGRARPYYYTRDHLGSIRELTDGSGNVQARYDYDPYGKQTKLNGALDVDFGYTGNYFHASSGLNLTLFRAYNPALGRWLSRDPIGEAVGLNLYGYVGNNSLRLVDPLGLTEEDPQGFGDADIVSTMGGPRGLYVAGQAPGIVRDTIIDGVTDVGTAVTPGEKLLLGIFKWFKKGKKCGVAYDYAPRVRARGVEDGVGHNFPYSFDNAILQTNPTIQPDGSWLYRMPGTINNTDGVFEIALNPETRTIFHRFFRGN